MCVVLVKIATLVAAKSVAAWSSDVAPLQRRSSGSEEVLRFFPYKKVYKKILVRKNSKILKILSVRKI